MIIEYTNAALKKALYKVLEDGSWFAEIPEFEGVWANGANVEECREELREVLEEWLIQNFRLCRSFLGRKTSIHGQRPTKNQNTKPSW
jgi:hypothetical protein